MRTFELILHNLKSIVVLAHLYDKMESQLRSLETLGVTSDKCAAMLYPLLESCFLEDLLRAWQRQSNNDADTNLDGMLDFLHKGVKNEE